MIGQSGVVDTFSVVSKVIVRCALRLWLAFCACEQRVLQRAQDCKWGRIEDTQEGYY